MKKKKTYLVSIQDTDNSMDTRTYLVDMTAGQASKLKNALRAEYDNGQMYYFAVYVPKRVNFSYFLEK